MEGGNARIDLTPLMLESVFQGLKWVSLHTNTVNPGSLLEETPSLLLSSPHTCLEDIDHDFAITINGQKRLSERRLGLASL